MTPGRRVALGATIAVVVSVAHATPASAHVGGESFTSNYRTAITEVAPADPLLDVTVVDVDGTIELTWTGRGDLVVIGYEGEPYLRISDNGVERNLRSPATYLNEDRYAAVGLPLDADADAPARWVRISTGHRVRWHDHRTHWMDRVPPEEVRADPGQVTVIFAAWQIPINVDGADGSITGTLTWVPPPSPAPMVALICAVATAFAALLAPRWWARLALVITLFASAVFAVDSVGYATAASGRASTVGWLLVLPAGTVLVSVWVTLTHRRNASPTVWLPIAGVIVATVGGWDRLDVLDHSQIFHPWPDWWARSAVAICIASGTAIVIRYLIHIVPLAIRPSREG